MTAAALFASSFAVVFLLTSQSLWVNNGRYLSAFCYSAAIGGNQLVLLKLAPASTAIEAAAFIAGGPFAVLLAMYLLRHLHRR